MLMAVSEVLGVSSAANETIAARTLPSPASVMEMVFLPRMFIPSPAWM